MPPAFCAPNLLRILCPDTLLPFSNPKLSPTARVFSPANEEREAERQQLPEISPEGYYPHGQELSLARYVPAASHA
jgi:hypothetical protein